MSGVTKQDMTAQRTELKESFNDVTSLSQTFIQQADERFNQIELEQKKTREESSKVDDK